MTVNDQLEAEYPAMGRDAEREQEAEEWCDALTGDVDPHA
jgi:hypothetical protein